MRKLGGVCLRWMYTSVTVSVCIDRGTARPVAESVTVAPVMVFAGACMAKSVTVAPVVVFAGACIAALLSILISALPPGDCTIALPSSLSLSSMMMRRFLDGTIGSFRCSGTAGCWG